MKAQNKRYLFDGVNRHLGVLWHSAESSHLQKAMTDFQEATVTCGLPSSDG